MSVVKTHIDWSNGNATPMSSTGYDNYLTEMKYLSSPDADLSRYANSNQEGTPVTEVGPMPTYYADRYGGHYPIDSTIKVPDGSYTYVGTTDIPANRDEEPGYTTDENGFGNWGGNYGNIMAGWKYTPNIEGNNPTVADIQTLQRGGLVDPGYYRGGTGLMQSITGGLVMLSPFISAALATAAEAGAEAASAGAELAADAGSTTLPTSTASALTDASSELAVGSSSAGSLSGATGGTVSQIIDAGATFSTASEMGLSAQDIASNGFKLLTNTLKAEGIPEYAASMISSGLKEALKSGAIQGLTSAVTGNDYDVDAIWQGAVSGASSAALAPVASYITTALQNPEIMGSAALTAGQASTIASGVTGGTSGAISAAATGKDPGVGAMAGSASSATNTGVGNVLNNYGIDPTTSLTGNLLQGGLSSAVSSGVKGQDALAGGLSGAAVQTLSNALGGKINSINGDNANTTSATNGTSVTGGSTMAADDTTTDSNYDSSSGFGGAYDSKLTGLDYTNPFSTGGSDSSGGTSAWDSLLSNLSDPKVIAALAAAGLTVGGGIAGNISSNNAAQSQANAIITANNNAIAEQKRQYDQNRTDFAPYRNLGSSAAATLQSTLPTESTLKTRPTYSSQLLSSALPSSIDTSTKSLTTGASSNDPTTLSQASNRFDPAAYRTARPAASTTSDTSGLSSALNTGGAQSFLRKLGLGA
jgi:hypothetical protein